MRASERVARTNDLPRGLAAPARRALARALIERLDQVAALREEELNQLRQALREQGMSFTGEQQEEGVRA